LKLDHIRFGHFYIIPNTNQSYILAKPCITLLQYGYENCAWNNKKNDQLNEEKVPFCE